MLNKKLNFIIFDRISEVSGAELVGVLEQLPAWRRAKALQFRFEIDQFLCAKSYLLLCELLRTHYSIFEQPKFAYGEQGKPFLPEFKHIHFNISHCKRAILCVVSDQKVGCDVEEIGELPDNNFLNHVCNEQEKQQIYNAPNRALAFYRLWTQKEALLKLSGEGLSDKLPAILEQKSEQIHLETHENLAKKYVFSIASQNL